MEAALHVAEGVSAHAPAEFILDHLGQHLQHSAALEVKSAARCEQRCRPRHHTVCACCTRCARWLRTSPRMPVPPMETLPWLSLGSSLPLILAYVAMNSSPAASWIPSLTATRQRPPVFSLTAARAPRKRNACSVSAAACAGGSGSCHARSNFFSQSASMERAHTMRGARGAGARLTLTGDAGEELLRVKRHLGAVHEVRAVQAIACAAAKHLRQSRTSSHSLISVD